MDERTDAELLMASGHDAAAFRVLYERWAQRLLGFFYRRTFDAEAAADLVAETFAVAYLKRRRFVDMGAPDGAWLFGIARRELGRYRRRRRVEMRALAKLGAARPPLDDESVARIDELVDITAYRSELDAALGRLTAKQRAAVRLRVVEDRTYPEVAEMLGCSEGAARVRVHRGLGRLAESLEAPP